MIIDYISLEDFQKSVKDLYILLDNLVEVWNFESYMILCTLVQNLYSTNDFDKIQQIVKTLHIFSNYRGKHCYLSTFVVNEIDMILQSFAE